MGDRIVNGTLTRIIGMARSGNHAIINWWLAQLPGQWLHLNCAEPKTNPFESARELESGRCYQTNDPRFCLAEAAAGRHRYRDHLLVSFEDSFLGPIFGEGGEASIEAGAERAGERRDALILRDPYNLFASRRRFAHSDVNERTAVRIWKQHARTFLDERRYPPEQVVRISYNDWTESQAYRRGLAERLGLPFTDEGRERVALCGGGSSFDGALYDGRASQMSVKDRWRRYHDDRDFWALFDDGVHELAETIFGFVPRAGLAGCRSRRPSR